MTMPELSRCSEVAVRLPQTRVLRALVSESGNREIDALRPFVREYPRAIA
jgi:hypothetical protein